MRKIKPLNVGLPIGWHGLIVDGGASGRTFERVDGITTPGNEYFELLVTVSRPLVKGSHISVKCVTKV
jgi:hypothetical protein